MSEEEIPGTRIWPLDDKQRRHLAGELAASAERMAQRALNEEDASDADRAASGALKLTQAVAALSRRW